MKTIVLGREGTQPFKIKNEDVSRQHAQITIDDHGEWVLEDLNSSNGTFIRNEKGDLVRVGRVNITPMTFICLGPDNSKGCFFYAKQVENYGDFREEYEYLTELEDEYDEKIEKLEEKEHTQKMIVFVVNVLVMIVTFFTKPLDDIIPDFRLNIMRAVPVLSTGFAAFYNTNGMKKELKAELEKFHHCPNPLCSHILKSSEIREMKCSKCKK